MGALWEELSNARRELEAVREIGTPGGGVRYVKKTSGAEKREREKNIKNSKNLLATFDTR